MIDLRFILLLLFFQNPFRNILDDNQCKSGSVSSLDLIQDAISDIDSVSDPFSVLFLF